MNAVCLNVRAREIGENAHDLLQSMFPLGSPARDRERSLLAAMLQGLHLHMPRDCTNSFRKVLEPERASNFHLHNPVK